MADQTIICPNCQHEIPLTQALSHQLQEKLSKEYETKLVEKEKELQVKAQEKARQELGLELKNKANEMVELKEQNKSLTAQLVELTTLMRQLKKSSEEKEFEMQKKLAAEEDKIRQEVRVKTEDEHKLKEAEKDKKISDMEKLVEELKRKSQQGSMQTQGEVAELELETTLRSLFPTDEITEVKKGELGGDVRQVVKSLRGTVCGLILWERKRTKSWDEEWVSKLKEDMRRDNAHLGVIVSEVLPKDFKKEIGERNGIWVVTSSFVEPIGALLRKNLYDIAKDKAIILNKQGKAEEIYDFVTSQEFIRQVERMVEIYLEMKTQISKERAVSEKLWKQREMQVEGLLKGVSGIYGGMQLIAGTALPQVKSLELTDELPT